MNYLRALLLCCAFLMISCGEKETIKEVPVESKCASICQSFQECNEITGVCDLKPGSCLDENDCESEDICKYNQCENVECKIKSDCGTGHYCEKNRCYAEPETTCDPVCNDWEKCVDSGESKSCTLILGNCYDENNCESTEICSSHRCIPVQCKVQSDCRTNETCEEHRCKEVTCDPVCSDWETCQAVDGIGSCKLPLGACDDERNCAPQEICYEHRCSKVQCKVDSDCYDTTCDQDTNKCIPNQVAMVTISGKVDGVINSDIKFFNTEGIFLGATRSNDTGDYSIDIDQSIYFDGYRIEVSGGTYLSGTENIDFTEVLSAAYFKSDGLLIESNVTLITTLIHRYALSLNEDYLKIAMKNSLNKFDSIAMIKKEEWNALDLEYVNEAILKTKALKETGVEAWLKFTKDELNSGDYSYETASYFPDVNGGIVNLETGKIDNEFSTYKGLAFNAFIEVNKYNKEEVRDITYELVNAPEQMSIDTTGTLKYNVSESNETETLSFKVKVTDVKTKIEHILDLKLRINETDIVLQGIIGSGGGELKNHYGDYVLTVPENAVSEDSEFKVLRYKDQKEGNYSYRTICDKELSKMPLLLTPISDIDQNDIGKRQAKSFKNQVTITARFILSWKARYIEIKKMFMAHPKNRTTPDGAAPSYDGIDVETNVVASELYFYNGGEAYNTNGDPILLIHGFTQLGKLGGGTGTWGETGRLLSEAGYKVYEFRWRTTTAFKYPADDLAKAIRLVSGENNAKKVTIIAHSFGGILARTYLQNHAYSEPYRDNIQSLITLGTPHSGIFDKDGIYFDIGFPAGQDSLAFEGCLQLSCHDAGEATPNAYTDNNTFVTDNVMNEIFGVQEAPGEAVARIAIMNEAHKLPVDTLVLMGIRVDKSSHINFLNLGNGDGLITYNAQRFFPRITNLDDFLGEGDTCGFSCDVELKEKLLNEHWVGLNIFKPYTYWNYTKGFSHSKSSWNDITTGNWSAYNNREAYMDSTNHVSYKEIISWLDTHRATPIVSSPQILKFKLKIVDAETHLPLTDAKIAYQDGTVTNMDYINVDSNGEVILSILYDEVYENSFSFHMKELSGYHVVARIAAYNVVSYSSEIIDLGEIGVYREVGESVCDTITCSNHGACTVVDDKATCVCAPDYINSGNAGLECIPEGGCPDGYHLLNGVCVPNATNLCSNINCPNRATCNETTGRCECYAGYEMIGGDCVFDHAGSENCGVDGMCLITDGLFMMGCNRLIDGECSSKTNENPEHEVTLSDYKIDRYEVTVADFRDCINAGVCTIDNYTSWHITDSSLCNLSRLGGGYDDHPMNCVNWHGANEYCQWAGKRLPTEAEWEYAARGRNSSKYPWGNDEPTCEHAVYSGCSDGETSTIGSKPLGKSPFGLYDMSGNVWEWVADYYDASYYTGDPITDPQGSETGSFRVLRGGAWYNSSSPLRASYRSGITPTIRNHYFGFRCVKSQ